jgi:integrase/recombinase XerD
MLERSDPTIVEDYLTAMRAAGRKTGRSTIQAAHSCLARIGRAGGWSDLRLAEQADAVVKAPSFTSWLMVTGRITVDAELLSRTDLRPGLPARSFCTADYQWFTETCSRIGVSSRDTAAQWNILAKITAITGTAPRAVTDEHFDAARIAMTTAYARRGKPTADKNVAAIFHRLRLTLFHAGRITTMRQPTVKPPVSVTGWAPVAPGFAATARRYVEQVTVSLRASTVKAIEHDLRQFGTWLAHTYPEVGSCTDLDRAHIEAFKRWLSTHPTPSTGKPLNRVSIKNALINLHCFFTRITEWGYENAPTRPLIFPGDLPIIDKPLPRFLDDAAATKLLRSVRADPDPLSRLIVELLARTGIRRGELLALTADAVVQIGSAYWLRIPIGKLHNDRYIPLHPQLKELLDDWITHHRPTGLRTNRLLLDDEGREMRKLRTEMHRRMLGNGYCARPVEMDCHFESICESCIFFVTTIEFRPTLQRQRDDAARKGQIGRPKVFDGLLNRLDTSAS